MGKSWTGGQYSVFRALLGAYLFVHFAHLLPWGAEVFSYQGMLAQASASPIFNLLPNVLAVSDAPWMIVALLSAGAFCAILFGIGWQDKPLALAMWYILACLFARNPLIANPALPYVGWMLLAHLFIPAAPFGSLAAAGRSDPGGAWTSPRPIFIAAWIVLSLSYSYSGYTKLLSPSWVSGDTVHYVLENPLARDYFVTHLLLASPEPLLRWLTWTILGVELMFAPLALIARLRALLWFTMLLVQLGFLALLNFADLTTPMLLFHLLTFDPAWIAGKRATAQETIYYDGHCGLCHRVVRFVLAEDQNAHFRFAPLQGPSFSGAISETVRSTLPDSFVVIDDRGQRHLQSDAVILVLSRLGGLWGLASLALQAVPKALRDRSYNGIGRIRHRLFPRPPTACPVVPSALSLRFDP